MSANLLANLVVHGILAQCVAVTSLFSYWDNYLMLHDPSPTSPFLAMTVEDFQNQMGHLLKMELTIEARGRSLGFLESQVTFHGNQPPIFVKSPVFESSPSDSIPAAPRRWLDKHSPNARSMLGLLVPNVTKKCAHYRLKHVPSVYALNVCNVAKVLFVKANPVHWW